MIKSVLLGGLLLAFACNLPGQSLTTPAGMVEIMENSTLEYKIFQTEPGELFLPAHKMENFPGVIVTPGANGVPNIRHGATPEAAKETIAQGDSLFFNYQYSEARSYYLRALGQAPLLTNTHIFIGQTYYMEDNLDSAGFWYKSAIENEFYDYAGHWVYADLLTRQGHIEEAVREITLAIILNRNSPKIMESAIGIYESSGRKFQDWEFRPDYRIKKKGNTVAVYAAPGWKWYGIARAIWRFETEYAVESEWALNGLGEDREAILNLMLEYEENGGKNPATDPAIRAIQTSLEKDLISEFILVEIRLRQEPALVYVQSKEAIQKMASYFMEIRGHNKGID